VVVESDSNGLDLHRLGYVLGMEKTLRKGNVGYVMNVSLGRDGLQGTAVLDMKDACFGKIDGLTGHLDTRMDGRDVQAALNFGAEGVGTLHADPIRLELGKKGALDGASWESATGEVKLDGDIDLGKLAAILPPNTLPVSKIAGHVTIRGDITRAAGSDDVPDLKLDVKTSGLDIAQKRRPDVVKHGVVMVSQPLPGPTGIDFHLITEVYGKRGAGNVALWLTDKHGALLAANASSDAVPFKELLASNDLAQRLLRVPLRVTVNAPARPLSELPDVLKVAAVDGTAQASLSVEGTALAPTLTFEAKATNVRLNASRREQPIAADIKAKYDGTRGDLSVTIDDPNQELLAMTARLDGKVADFAGRGADAPWVASTNAKLEHFPLEAIPMLADRRMHGTLDGQFDLTDLHKDTRAKVDVDATGLRVGRQKYGGGKVAVTYDGKALTADVKLTQDSGSMDASAKVPLRWGADLAPSRDPAGPIQARLNAKNLRVGFLAPFLQSVLDSLDGVLDADGQIDLEPNQKPSIRGQVQFSKGVIGVPQLGEDLRGVKAHVALNQDGTVKLDGVEAFGAAGRLTASGAAKLDGTTLVNAQLDASIAKNEAIPVTAEGTDVGRVYGNFDVRVTNAADQRSMTIAVDVPSVHIQMADAPQHSVQELGELPENNHIGVYTQPDRFMALPLDGHESGAKADAEPGNLVTIGVTIGEAEIARGTDLRAQLGGKLTAKLEQKTDVTGQIKLHGGRLDVQGKSFQIETGTVTFTGDPSNPDVRVTAGWTAEDGTKVYADYVGPLQTGKVTLRSEPARPQNEIVALILFGTADGSESTPHAGPSEDTGTQAGTTIGGFATGGLSKGLNKLTGLDVTAKIDTSGTNPKPEVEVQIARSISLELAYVLGTPPPGTNQDTTYATIDWRFLRQWSLETTFGNLGASIADVVWRHRY
jgi:translocation and assembly module TamB